MNSLGLNVFGERQTIVETVLNKLTMSFDDDGKMTLFADLEKITEKQKERLEELKENVQRRKAGKDEL